MNEPSLVQLFEEKRQHLCAVAFRMLGSQSEAEDAVQESWLRLSRSDTTEVENLGAWLTTVVSRVCLDLLRSRKSRREEAMGAHVPEPVERREAGSDPEHEAVLADSVGLAMLVVLDALTPAERLAFVLHDMFAISFEDIGPIVGRSATAARQLASRARRRVRGASAVDAGRARQREVIDAFLAASRDGDFAGLLDLLDPEALVRADSLPIGTGIVARGASAVAGTFVGRARAARPALLNGVPGLVWAPAGVPKVLFAFTIARGKIVEIEMISDPQRMGLLDVKID